MNDAEAIETIKKLVELEQAGERTTLVIGPYSAYLLVSTLQLALRHPEISAPIYMAVRDFAAQVESLFDGTPAGEVLALGWDTDNDRGWSTDA